MDKELFQQVFDRFQSVYSRRGLHMVGTIVWCDNKECFNTDGFNLLYNLKRLTDLLEDELR